MRTQKLPGPPTCYPNYSSDLINTMTHTLRLTKAIQGQPHPSFAKRLRCGGLAASLGLGFVFTGALRAAEEPVDAVNPLVGVRPNRGSTVIGPTLPHGSIHPSPDTPEGMHAGYHSKKPIRGFSQLHVSGTGWGRYGNLMLSPQIGLRVSPEAHDSDKAEEVATPYSYKVRLSRYNILTELAPTRHAVLYQFTYPAADDAHLSLDLGQQIPGQIATQITDVYVRDSRVSLDPKRRVVSGSSRYAGGFGMGNYVVYFYGELDTTPSASGTWKNRQITPDALNESWRTEGDRVGAWWRFSTKDGAVVRLKLAVSFHSVEKARDYLREEIPGWSLQAVSDAGRAQWNEALGCIAVKGGDAEQRTRFYTALYHAQLMPRERTGDLARFEAKRPMWDDQYAVWDTWRTTFPLMLLIKPRMVRENIASFVERLRVDGQVRDTFSAGWGGMKNPELVRGETVENSLRCQEDQGGNDVDNIIADAYVKGLRGVDWQAAYGVLAHNAQHERKGTAAGTEHTYRQHGWIPAGTMSVSNTQEYAYNDFVASQVAHGLGYASDAAHYLARSRQWQNLFNPEAQSDGFKGFVAPRTEDGRWPSFDLKKYPGSWDLYFYEANSWTYSLFAPHQSGLLVEWMGGREQFIQRLLHAQAANLISFDNEPGFLAPFLFHYAGRPDLASQSVREVVRQRFNELSYPGDDDSGAMSSYYVWAALGLFPNAGQDFYFLNGPLFEHITVNRPEEGKLEIIRSGRGDFVASVTLNGKPFKRSWCRHNEIKGDTTLVFTMSETPGDWGKEEPPPSDNFIATPNPPPSGNSLLNPIN